MRKAMIAAGLVLAGCSESKAPAPQLALQPILYFDITQNKLYGTGCNFVPANGGMGAVFLAQGRRGLIKVDDHIVTIPVATDAAALPEGGRTHYSGVLYSAMLTPVPGGAKKPIGVIAVFTGHLVITDAKHQAVYDATGDVQCKPV